MKIKFRGLNDIDYDDIMVYILCMCFKKEKI